jgi:hypothetical protein
MRLRLAILVVCAFALLAAPAHADHGVTVVDATVARYMQIAAAYWNAPEPVCTSQDGGTIHPHAVIADDPDPAVAAWAEVGGCHMWLDRDYWPAPPSEQYCNLIAHEWGHLLGHGHSTNPNDLMWPQWTNDVVPGCQVFRSPERLTEPSPSTVKVLRLTKAQRAKRACAARRHRGRRAYARWLRRHPNRAHQLGCVGRHHGAGARTRVTLHWHGGQLERGTFAEAPVADQASFSMPLTIGALR